MGSLPQHSVIEFRRYMNRFLYLFPDLSDMRGVMRTPVNQHQFFIEPLVAWLRPRGVNFLTDTFVRDIGFAAAPTRITVNRLDYERRGTATSVEVATEDLVLMTTGSQAADLSAGSMTEVPGPRPSWRSWALWERLAQGRRDFGNPDIYFGTARIPDSLWVTFTVTDTRPEFVNQIAALTGSEAGLGGLVTLKDSGLGAVAVRLSPTRNYRPAQGHERLVGLRSVPRAQRRFYTQTHDGVHRHRDPGGDAAAKIGRAHV